MRILYRLDLRTGKEIKGASPSIFTHIHTHTHTHTHTQRHDYSSYRVG